jgi:hypothetical protein
LCLRIVNKLFSTQISGCGYLDQSDDQRDKEDVGIPDVEADYFTEEEWYAAKFWLTHIIQVDNPTVDVIQALREFLSKHLLAWSELITSKWRYQSLLPLLRWLEVSRF